jgi:hypothetical protein
MPRMYLFEGVLVVETAESRGLGGATAGKGGPAPQGYNFCTCPTQSAPR